jgi:hypothetical protein
MDLRKYRINHDQIQQGMAVLNYQPFILSDDIETGVAHSWLYGEESGRLANSGDFVWQKGTMPAEAWNRFADANARLRAMYEDWLDVIATTYPGGTLLDPACNNGYFLAGALQRGMKKATGYDRADYIGSVQFLNDVVGVNAKFVHRAYSPWTHRIDDCVPHDVAVASLILCHNQ